MPDMEGTAETPVEPPQASLSDCEKGIETGPSTAASPNSKHDDSNKIPKQQCIKSVDDIPVIIPPAALIDRRCVVLTAAALNALGTLGFVVTAALWCFNLENVAAIVFAASAICIAIEQTVISVKFYMADDSIGVYLYLQCVVGCLSLTTGSLLFYFDLSDVLPKSCLLIASLCFLTAWPLAPLQQGAWIGAWAPLIPNSAKFIPVDLLNILGSLLFSIGSGFYFFPEFRMVFNIFYVIGSVNFFFAAWGKGAIQWSATQLPQKSAAYCVGPAARAE